jgi:hypothetical protein
MAILGYVLGLVIATMIAASFLRHNLRFTTSRLFRTNLAPALSLGVRGQAGNIAMFFNYGLVWQIPSAAALVLFPRTARTLDRGAARFTCFVARQVLLLAIGLGIGLRQPIHHPLDIWNPLCAERAGNLVGLARNCSARSRQGDGRRRREGGPSTILSLLWARDF